MKWLFLFLSALLPIAAFAQAGDGSMISGYQNNGALQDGDLFIFERPSDNDYNINRLQLLGAIGAQPTNANLTDWSAWGTNAYANVVSNRTVAGAQIIANTTSNALQTGINTLGSNSTNNVNTTSNVLAGLITSGGAPLAITITNSGDGNFNQHAYTNASQFGVGNWYLQTNKFGLLFTNPVLAAGIIMTNGQITVNGKTNATTDQLLSLSTTAPAVTNQYAYYNGDNGNTNLGGTINGYAWTNLTGTNITLDTSSLATTGNGTNYTAILRSGLPGMESINAGTATNINLSVIGTNLADVGRSIFINNFTNAANCNLTFTFTAVTNLNFNSVVSNGCAAIINLWNADTSGSNVIVSDAGRYHH